MPSSAAGCCSTASTSTCRSMRATEARKRIGMVFQKPNPFPAMTIEDNVLAGLRFAGRKVRSIRAPRPRAARCSKRPACGTRCATVFAASGASCQVASSSDSASPGRWRYSPNVLLMDEPCSALDPTSTRRIEQTIRGDRRGRHRRHRHPQHAAGPTGLAPMRLLPGGGEPARAHRRVGRRPPRSSRTQTTRGRPTMSTGASADRRRSVVRRRPLVRRRADPARPRARRLLRGSGLGRAGFARGADRSRGERHRRCRLGRTGARRRAARQRRRLQLRRRGDQPVGR